MNRDTLSDLWRSVRLRGAVFDYVSFRDVWAAEGLAAEQVAPAVLPGCEDVMAYHMVAKGTGWASIAGLPPVRLSEGDIGMFPQGDRQVISSVLGINPPPVDVDWIFASRNDRKPLSLAYHHGVRQPGALVPVADSDAVLVCGFLGCDARPFNPLISALPRILHLPAGRAGDWVSSVIDQAALESHARRPGGEAVLERLSEMMFVDAARRDLDALPSDATGWLAGLRDRFVGRALSPMHELPDFAWSFDDLARAVGLSRSALHERFLQYLGNPPMQYLASWRIQLSTRLLPESKRNVATISADVGYASEAAFSRAFRRLVGMPPAAWRRAQMA